jgi:hypothetical protein
MSASGFAGMNFAGPYKANYQAFIKFVQEDFISNLMAMAPEERDGLLQHLGAIAKTDEHYFTPSQEVQYYSQKFFAAFWSSQQNIKLIDDHQQAKFQMTKKRCSVPQCISFVIADVDSSAGLQKICFVSVSSFGSTQHSEVWSAIRDFIEVFNQKNLEEDEDEAEEGAFPAARYELLDLASEDFHDLMIVANKFINATLLKGLGLSFPEDGKRECAEKGFITELVKLFYERAIKKMNIQINGVLNAMFYPFDKQTFSEKTKKHIVVGEKVISKDGNTYFDVMNGAGSVFRMPVITCCPNCRLYKNTTLYLMLAAKYYGLHNLNKIASSPLRNGTSPLKVKITPERRDTASTGSVVPSPSNMPIRRAALHTFFSSVSPVAESEEEEKLPSEGAKINDSSSPENRLARMHDVIMGQGSNSK